jgi:hypothetical protein
MTITIEHENLTEPIVVTWTRNGSHNTMIQNPTSGVTSCYTESPEQALAKALNEALR